jgi:hypothetical protein
MKGKQILTVLLLAFVAASVGYLILRDTPTAGSSVPASPAAAAAAPTPSGAPGAPAPEAASPPAAPAAPRFAAWYFHGTRRCHTCQTIEAYAREAIETAFADDLRQGRLTWASVNLEDAGNEHFATDYKVAGSTLVVAELKDGKPIRFAKLDKTWDLVGEKPQFMDYVALEVDAFIGAGR